MDHPVVLHESEQMLNPGKRGSEHTLSHLSGGVSARGTLVLLDVQRTAA
jgi:hypothetical protein